MKRLKKKLRNYIWNKHVKTVANKEQKTLNYAANIFKYLNRGKNKAYIFLSGKEGRELLEKHNSILKQRNVEIKSINRILRAFLDINEISECDMKNVLGIPIIFDDYNIENHAEIRALGNYINYVEGKEDDGMKNISIELMEEKQEDKIYTIDELINYRNSHNKD